MERFQEQYSGSLNLSLICQGQTSLSYQTGSLTIYGYSEISPVEVPNLTENSDSLPSTPYWLSFSGSSTSIEKRRITTAVTTRSEFPVSLKRFEK